MNLTNVIVFILIGSFSLLIEAPYKSISGDHQQSITQNLNEFPNAVYQSCKSDNEWARKNVEIFLSHKDWAPERQETNTTGLSVSQVQLLDKQEEACQFFNIRYEEAITEKYEANNDSVYHVVYYEVGEFYFVSIVLAQPSDPNVVTTGLSFIIIFDNNLNKVKGYSF